MPCGIYSPFAPFAVQDLQVISCLTIIYILGEVHLNLQWDASENCFSRFSHVLKYQTRDCLCHNAVKCAAVISQISA